MQKFVLFSMPRTGSTWLRLVLDSHPDITCYAALFRHNRWRPNELRKLLKTPDPRFYEVAYRMQNFESVWESVLAATPPSRHVGLKHMAVGEKKVTKYLAKDPQFRKVILRRDNHLAIYASNLLAKTTGQAHVLRRKNVPVKREPIFFRSEDFDRFSSHYERVYADLKNLCVGEVIEIEYNAVRQGEDLERVADFFGVDAKELVSDRTLKRGNDSIVDRFENRDDVLAYLKDRDQLQWAVER